ncbi:MAG: hypothetical protein OFPI_14120 [Osedax symbiont Rs2]|nr:MAG: hypothetical protein OFPI_14120 [Osedax symbiont Rs2]
MRVNVAEQKVNLSISPPNTAIVNTVVIVINSLFYRAAFKKMRLMTVVNSTFNRHWLSTLATLAASFPIMAVF